MRFHLKIILFCNANRIYFLKFAYFNQIDYICTFIILFTIDNMDITSRIKRFMEHEQLTNSQFADKCRIPRPTLSQILNGRNKKISDELIGKLHESFPHLSILWLMFGEGDMISAENIKTSEPQFNNIRQNSYTQRSDSKENILSFDMDSNMIDFTAENITQPSFHQSEEPFVNFHKQTEQISDKKDIYASDNNTVYPENEHTDTNIPIPTSIQGKTIQTIMVFYTDNSFQMFTPAVNKCMNK